LGGKRFLHFRLTYIPQICSTSYFCPTLCFH